MSPFVVVLLILAVAFGAIGAMLMFFGVITALMEAATSLLEGLGPYTWQPGMWRDAATLLIGGSIGLSIGIGFAVASYQAAKAVGMTL